VAGHRGLLLVGKAQAEVRAALAAICADPSFPMHAAEFAEPTLCIREEGAEKLGLTRERHPSPMDKVDALSP
jgi:predicted trehalose synthase